MNNAFTPSRWWRNRHLQTIWPWVTKPRRKPQLRRERLELSDGDFLDLDWLGTPSSSEPLMLVLHGLEGSVDSHYIRRLLLSAEQTGRPAVLMHQRSCSGELNRLPRSYHSGETGDLGEVLAHLARAYPNQAIHAVGYSLGGNQLCKYLGEQAHGSAVARAVLVSPPLDLAQCAKAMETGFAKVYQKHLVDKLKAKTVQKLAEGKAGTLTPERLDSLTTFFHFDDAVTAPLHGFTDAADYYRQSSGNAFMDRIQVPTLLLHALDDPFMTPDVVPATDKISPEVELELWPRGGHVGFIEGGWPWSPRYYLERRLLQFLFP